MRSVQPQSQRRHRVELLGIRGIQICLPTCPPERALHDTVISLPTQVASSPPIPCRLPHVQVQIIREFRDQKLGLLRQARHVHKALRRVARTTAHQSFPGAPMDSLGADVARLALGVFGALLDRDRYGFRVILICSVLLGTACLFYYFAELVMASGLPVAFLAFRPTVSCAAAAAFLAQ